MVIIIPQGENSLMDIIVKQFLQMNGCSPEEKKYKAILFKEGCVLTQQTMRRCMTVVCPTVQK